MNKALIFHWFVVGLTIFIVIFMGFIGLYYNAGECSQLTEQNKSIIGFGDRSNISSPPTYPIEEITTKTKRLI